MRVLLSLLTLIICANSYAQLDVRFGQAYLLPADTKIGKTDGGQVLLESADVLSGRSGSAVVAETAAANVDFEVEDQSRNPVEFDRLSLKSIFLPKPGKFWVEVTAIDFKQNIYGKKTVVVEVGQGPNPPPGPDPPGPTPGPAPIDGIGLRVLIVYESSEAHLLNQTQREIIYGSKVREYLNENCAKGDDGFTADWRLLDADTKYTDPNNKFAKALARPRTELPWLIISNGETGYEGPLPVAVEEMMLTLRSFAANRNRGVRVNSPSVTMYSSKNCVHCRQFLSEERRKLDVPFIEQLDTQNMIATHPTFFVRLGDRSTKLTGYHTAEQITQAIVNLAEAH